MRKLTIAALSFALLGAGVASLAQESPPAEEAADQRSVAEYVAALHGTWSGSAKLFGQAVHTTASWESVLEGRFTRLELAHRQSTAEGPVMFAGHSYVTSVGKDAATTTGTWFDSSGAVRPQRLRVDDGALVVDWGDEETEVGRSTYTLREDGTLVVRDFVQREGGYQPFGGGELTRE